MQAASQVQTFHPEQASRRGELIAWGAALLVAAGWAVLLATGNRAPGSVPFLAVVLLLAALSISFGNWMDRRTSLSLDPDGVHFQNGLRNVRLGWADIRQVQVFPSKWGQRVSVIGPVSHFEFRTFAEVKVQGQVKGQMGFTEGEHILQAILDSAGLVHNPDSTSTDPYYYVRK